MTRGKGVGTDVMGMTTTAQLSADGSHYVLNGAKMWITNGTIDGTDTGDVFLVYAKTGKGRAAKDVTSFLVEKGMPGFSLGQKINDKCGMRASNTAELVFDDVKVFWMNNFIYLFISTWSLCLSGAGW